MSSRSAPDSHDLVHLRVQRHDPGVAVVTLDNQSQRNAMSPQMTASWGRVMAELAADPDLRVVVVTGAGAAFCAGGDLSWIAPDPEAAVDRLRARMLGFYRAWLAVRDLEVPTIAAVNGPAVGAGLCLALACDIRLASAGARLSAPFVRLGMHPGMGATQLLTEVAGAGVARDLLLTGRSVAAEEALSLGLVSRVLAAETFQDEVLEVARGIAGTAPIAARSTKRTLAAGPRDLEAAVQWEALAQSATLVTADVQEGVRAARERRTPDFRGR